MKIPVQRTVGDIVSGVGTGEETPSLSAPPSDVIRGGNPWKSAEIYYRVGIFAQQDPAPGSYRISRQPPVTSAKISMNCSGWLRNATARGRPIRS